MKTTMMPYWMCCMLLVTSSIVGIVHADDTESAMQDTMESTMKPEQHGMEANQHESKMESKGESMTGDMKEPTDSDKGMRKKPMAESEM